MCKSRVQMEKKDQRLSGSGWMLACILLGKSDGLKCDMCDTSIGYAYFSCNGEICRIH